MTITKDFWRRPVVDQIAPQLETGSIATNRVARATFLCASDFMNMATSRRKLFRADEPRSGVRGLVDPVTGDRYLIETNRLRLP
jgi:hypothetical protein